MSPSPLLWRLLDSPSHLVYLACVSCIINLLYNSYQRNKQYAAIPAVGRTGLLTSYIDAIRFYKYGKEMIDEGYQKYHPGPFRVPTLGGWFILITGDKQVEELRQAPDRLLSFMEATGDSLAADYTLGSNIHEDPYHVALIRGNLTRYLQDICADVHDEVSHAFADVIPAKDEWIPYKALPSILNIVARVSNRTFVGLPVCREPEYLQLNIDFTINVILAARIINMFPAILKSFAAKMFTKVSKSIEIGMKYIGPLIEERRRLRAEYGPNYPDKPNDMLSWLMDEAKGEEQSIRNLTLRLLTLNFASIHTTSMTFTHGLLELANRPEYIEPIRAQIEQAINTYGWTKTAIGQMSKLDSFLREDQRLAGLGAVSMSRKALHDFVFEDGTYIPKGSTVQAASWARHHDDRVWKDAKSFNGFRYSDLEEEERSKNQIVATSTSFLQFGHGRHACPGRFFASMEMKTMMAHLLMNYDIKVVAPPKHFWIAENFVIDSQAEIMIKGRDVGL